MPTPSLRETLETRQIPLYFGTVVLAGLIAIWQPATQGLAGAIDPLLAFMLFVTFLQVPMHELRRAASNLRFVGALALANFLLIPLLVLAMLPWLPGDPLLRIGVLLVLLTPCIDYVVTFAHLGRADARALLASTPLLLAAQMLLLPFYLRLLLDADAARLVQWGPFLHAFVWLIAVPLGLAALCQAWGRRRAAGARALDLLGVMPVPATAAVLAVVVASVTPQLAVAMDAVRQVAPLYLGFALLAPLLGWGVARLCRLPLPQRLAVAFSSATRNSLVVLPLGLAIPGALPVLPAVIVTQTLIELVSQLLYVRLGRTLAGAAARART